MFEDAGRAPGVTSLHGAAASHVGGHIGGTLAAPVLEDAQAIIALRESLAGMAPAASVAALRSASTASPGTPAVPGAPAARATSASPAVHTPGARFGPSEEELAAVTREAEAINRIRALEDLKAACAAAQARETAALHTHRHRDEAARGIPATRRGRGLGSEIGLARRQNQQRGSTHLRQAIHLTEDLTNTLTALQTGQISEEHAATVERHTHWLPEQARRNVDTALAVADRLTDLGIRELVQETQAMAHREDPEAAAEQYDQAVTTRHVNIKPTDNGMAYLTALLPAMEAAACHQALIDQAATALAFGEAEGRSPQQVLSDVFVERLTGRSPNETSPVEIQLIMTDTALLAGGSEPAWLPGHGPLPADTARKLVAGGPGPGSSPGSDSSSSSNTSSSSNGGSTTADQAQEVEARVFLRRLYTSPETGHLVAMDSQRREFPGKLRHMIMMRDNICRTPYCGSPIRHIDHATPHRDGGPTSYANGSGLCARCNYTKEHPGWTHRATPNDLKVTTPTGHQYTSQSRPLTALPTEPAREAAPATAVASNDALGPVDYLRPRIRPGSRVEYAWAA